METIKLALVNDGRSKLTNPLLFLWILIYLIYGSKLMVSYYFISLIWLVQLVVNMLHMYLTWNHFSTSLHEFADACTQEGLGVKTW